MNSQSSELKYLLLLYNHFHNRLFGYSHLARSNAPYLNDVLPYLGQYKILVLQRAFIYYPG